ncbi:MAG: circadian clock protein KaiA [Prochlorococcaceae cyanobacterium]
MISEPSSPDLASPDLASPEPALTIVSLLRDQRLQQACQQWLRGGRYQLVSLDPDAEPAAELERRREDFDVVLLESGVLSPDHYQYLVNQGLVLPAVVLGPVSGLLEFHDAEVHLPPDQLEQLSYSVDAAVSRILRRGPLGSGSAVPDAGSATPDRWKLANRLKGRLGYLGVFYKRDPSRFLRNLPSDDRQDLLRSLERTYRDLLISYFRDPAAANQALESFVNTAFFSDLPITKTVEIHMNLIEGFWKQLKLEGHKNDFLQDYRLALLDVMAHLCEMYRRSVPPEASPAPPGGLQGFGPGSVSRDLQTSEVIG